MKQLQRLAAHELKELSISKREAEENYKISKSILCSTLQVKLEYESVITHALKIDQLSGKIKELL